MQRQFGRGSVLVWAMVGCPGLRLTLVMVRAEKKRKPREGLDSWKGLEEGSQSEGWAAKGNWLQELLALGSG